VDFVWTKSASLVFVASFGKAQFQHLVSRCALSERSIKLISCHHCASPFIGLLPEPEEIVTNIIVSQDAVSRGCKNTRKYVCGPCWGSSQYSFTLSFLQLLFCCEKLWQSKFVLLEKLGKLRIIWPCCNSNDPMGEVFAKTFVYERLKS